MFLSHIVDFWDKEMLAICNKKQDEKFNWIKNIIFNFDTYVENRLKHHEEALNWCH